MLLAFGRTIVEKMEGKDAFQYSLKRSEKVKTLATKTSVQLTGKDDATIDFYLLFQRSVALPKVSNISFEDCKEHELCPYLPALFKSISLMQKAGKTLLATAIADFVKSKSSAAVICKETEKIVLDGVFLLHLIPWEKNTMYQDIALKYAN